MITRALLRSLRNDLPMSFTFRKLGNKAPYSKTVEGRFRFQCPHCSETLAAVNPRNNLAHCFGCNKNINNIDLLILIGYDFTEAADLLQRWLALFHKDKARPQISSPLARPVENSATPRFAPVGGAGACPDPAEGAQLSGSILQRDFGNQASQRHG